MVVLAWNDPDRPGQARMSLHIIGPGSITLMKNQPQVIEFTKVNGKEAVWAVGPYLIGMKNGDTDFRRMVDGNVLIWYADDITYRLESDLPMEEAIKVAEFFTLITLLLQPNIFSAFCRATEQRDYLGCRLFNRLGSDIDQGPIAPAFKDLVGIGGFLAYIFQICIATNRGADMFQAHPAQLSQALRTHDQAHHPAPG